MPTVTPFFREAGSGPSVICLHANASSSSQWRALMERLSPRFHVLTPDSYGAGKSPFWSGDRAVALHDEVAFLEPVFARAAAPFVLVGHSYGAAIALIAALEQPRRIRALILYEPTLFSVVDADSPPPNEVEGIRETLKDAVAALKSGHRSAAAQGFIDYWMGAGSWASMPEARRKPVEQSIGNLQSWGRALIEEPTPLQAFAALELPVLYLTGKETRTPARGVARLLTGVLPRVECVEFDGLGHMGPLTHPEIVNEVVANFLERL